MPKLGEQGLVDGEVAGIEGVKDGVQRFVCLCVFDTPSREVVGMKTHRARCGGVGEESLDRLPLARSFIQGLHHKGTRIHCSGRQSNVHWQRRDEGLHRTPRHKALRLALMSLHDNQTIGFHATSHPGR